MKVSVKVIVFWGVKPCDMVIMSTIVGELGRCWQQVPPDYCYLSPRCHGAM
jgi:hypothetical protein